MQFVDGRASLPRHSTKRWKKRDVSRILGAAVHHTAGGDVPENTAAYHVGKDIPALAYTFYIPKSGTVWWANELDAKTWSQGGRTSPDVDGDGDVDSTDGAGDANGRFLAIVLGGSFDSKWNKTGQEPTGEQVLALLSLWGHLVGHSRVQGWPPELFNALGHLRMADLWTHADFGKIACPGRTITDLLVALRTHREVARSTEDWQRALVAAGYDLGKWGPKRDGVDGDWGSTSRDAIISFQRSAGLEPSGHRDDITADELFRSRR